MMATLQQCDEVIFDPVHEPVSRVIRRDQHPLAHA